MKKFLLLLATASLAMLACCTSPVFDDGLLDNLSENNKIYYTSTDGEKIFPNTLSNGVDAVLLSNTYKNGRGCMTFDEEVTKIAYLFPLNDRLVSVELPNSLTEIGTNSFYECENLVEITIPKKVSIVSTSAFTGCTSLPVENGIRYADNFLVGVVEKYSDSYTIKNGTKWIGDSAFKDCSSLTSITIPDSVTEIGDYAFEYCKSLTSVHITDIAAWCGISFSDWDANPLNYAHNLYLNGELVTNLVIPDSVTSIGDYAFYDCSSLTSITLPDSVTEIGEWAFSYCTSLTSITIPDSVTSIGNYAFYGCSSLTSITLPDSVTSIGDYAFYDCSSLTSITLPDSVTEIGEWAFSYCTSLTSVYCKATTPPAGDSDMFYNNASGRKIYVPAECVDAYKKADYWSNYKSYIYGYDF